MLDTHRSRTPLTILILRWIAYRLHLAVASLKPRLKALDIVAEVTRTGDPPGA